MSLEELAQQLEKSTPNENSTSSNLYAHATHELLYTYSERERKDKNGKSYKERYIDVDAKTELPNPISIALLESISVFLAEEFGSEKSDKDIDYFIERFKIDMISKDRQSRKEITEILRANALIPESQDSKVKLDKL